MQMDHGHPMGMPVALPHPISQAQQMTMRIWLGTICNCSPSLGRMGHHTYFMFQS
jgi:hypothetical protein